MICASFFSAIIPPVFSLMVIYEERDPLHKFLVEQMNIKPKLELKFLPLLIMMAFITSQIGNTFCFLLNSGLMFLHFTHSWMTLLTSKVTLKWSFTNNFGVSKIKKKMNLNFGNKADLPLVYTYRKLQVIHRLANQGFASPVVAYHFGAIMMLGVTCFLAIIRWHSLLNIISLILVVFAAIISLVVPYFEFLALSIIKGNSAEFVAKMIMRNKRSSIVTKIVKSFWLVQMETGKPFCSVSHHSILIYVENLVNFLTDFLVSTST